MFKPIKYLLFTISVTLALLLTACGADTAQEALIQTSVAQTVAAQNTVEVPNTATPSAPVIPTQTPFQLPTPLALLTSTVPPPNTLNAECAKASLVSETILDKTIFKPGEQFTKTWEITNTSNCVWDTNYKIVFWDGDILGGGFVYNLPQVVGPGQTFPVSLVLTAPTVDGIYRSEWKLQTPDQINFGVGFYNAAFYTEIEVSSAKNPKYAVTSVITSITRDPKTGCPANTLFTVYATVGTSGPVEFTYHWEQKDDNNSDGKLVTVKSATTKTFKREWKFGRANTQGPKWISFVITDPVYQAHRVDFEFICP